MNIKIPNDCKEIHILYTGGLDSALLLYLLAKQYQNVPVFSHTFHTKAITTLNNTIKFVEETEKKLNRKIIKNIYGNGSSSVLWIRKYVEFVQKLHNNCYVFSGCNRVPERKFIPEFLNTRIPSRGEPGNERHIRPFIDILKPQITAMYKEEKIVDLIKYTRSCGSVNGGECGICFFCHERRWAFNETGINIDTFSNGEQDEV